MTKTISIKPVNTDYSTYNLLRLSLIEQPMDTTITVVSVLSKDDEDDDWGTQISGQFTSLPKYSFAYDPGSLCDKLLPQLEDQGIIERNEDLDLYSGFSVFPVYRFTEAFLKENDLNI